MKNIICKYSEKFVNSQYQIIKTKGANFIKNPLFFFFYFTTNNDCFFNKIIHNFVSQRESNYI